MLALVMSFTVITLFSSGVMQTTEFQMTLEDLAEGFQFHFPLAVAALAIAMYGYTGVNGGEIAAYTYWCVEKGYPKYIGADSTDPRWVERAKGWIKVPPRGRVVDTHHLDSGNRAVLRARCRSAA